MVVATLHFSPMLPGRCAVWRQLGAAAVQAAAVQRTTQCQVQGHRSAALQHCSQHNTPSPLTAGELQHCHRRQARAARGEKTQFSAEE